jgi:hypothetical protein
MHDTAAVELPAATDLRNPGPRAASAWQDTGALSAADGWWMRVDASPQGAASDQLGICWTAARQLTHRDTQRSFAGMRFAAGRSAGGRFGQAFALREKRAPETPPVPL